MKAKWLSLALVGALVLSVAGCGGGGGSQASAEDEFKKGQEWAKKVGMDIMDEPVDVIYEKAKKEGKVVVYSISSRIKKVKASFEKKYPGVTVEAYDLSTNELLEKFGREYKSGIRNADLVHIKDQHGEIYNNYVKRGIFHNYYPADICKHIDEKYRKYAMPLYIELNQWFYNTQKYPDAPPIDSWWDLTRPEWKGKFLMNNPLDNISTMAILTALVQNSEDLAKDYKREFGEEIKLSDGCKNAGEELIKRLAANKPVYIHSSDEIVQNVGTPDQADPPVGYASSSKMRQVKDKGYTMNVMTKILPTTGIPAQNNLYIANECQHPYAAKLLLRWMLGEADGKGEGFKPFNTLGGWPVRDDVELAKGSTPLKDIPLWPDDPEYIYQHISEMNDFWLSVQDAGK